MSNQIAGFVFIRFYWLAFVIRCPVHAELQRKNCATMSLVVSDELHVRKSPVWMSSHTRTTCNQRYSFELRLFVPDFSLESAATGILVQEIFIQK